MKHVLTNSRSFWDRYFTLDTGLSSTLNAGYNITMASTEVVTYGKEGVVEGKTHTGPTGSKSLATSSKSVLPKALGIELGRSTLSLVKSEDEHFMSEESNAKLLIKNDTSRKDYSCLTISIYSAIVIAMVCIFLVLGRDYIKYVLLSLEKSNLWISLIIFSLLFCVVSFPMTWGYILLNVACGYLYGLLLGIVIVIMCALCGLTAAHLLIKRFLQDFVFDRLANDSMRAIIRVVDSEHGFKVVVLARLTPIPFGLQNALFAMSKMSLQRYIAASITGMLPTQGLHAYFGSTLRSMEEVISTSSGSSTAYVVFGAQLLMVFVLLIFVVRKARLEFNRTLLEAESIDLSSPDSSQSYAISVEPVTPAQISSSSHILLNSLNCV